MQTFTFFAIIGLHIKKEVVLLIYGIGVDIIEIARIEKAMHRSNNFLEKVFTDEEIKFYKSHNFRTESIAGGYAAKEAVSKAIGTGFRGFSLKDIVIKRDELGKPLVELLGKARDIVSEKGNFKVHLSISHSDSNAVAYVVLEV